MSTHKNIGLNIQENSPNKLKKPKNMVHTSEAIIIGDTCKQKCRPNLPTVKDTIQILNNAIIRPPIPSINETVLLNKQCILPKNKPTKVDKIILNNCAEEQKTEKNTKATETKLYIEKKKKERTSKCKLDLLEKKKLAEERKKKLDELQKTTRELAIASKKQKAINVQDKCKIDISLPTESNEPKVDQTWSPPPKVKSVRKPLEALRNVQKIGINLLTESNESKMDQTWSPPPKVKNCKKPLEAHKNVQKKSIKDFKITDEYSNDTKDVISACEFSKMSKIPSTISTTKLIDSKPKIRDVTKPENLFSKLKFNDDYQLFGKNLCDISMPKANDIDTSSIQKCNNDVTLLNGSCHDNEKQKSDSAHLNREELTMPDINLSIKSLDNLNNCTKSHTGLQLPIKSHEEIMKSIDNLEELQELLFDQCLPVKNCYTESTQTENCNNMLSLSTLKSPPPPMSFISVLKCKHNLQQSEKNNSEVYEPAANLNMNKHTITNNLYSNKTNNVEFTEFNKPDVNICNVEVNLPNVNDIETKNCLDSYKPLLIDEPIKLKPNNLSSIEIIENNNCEEKINIVNNDKLFTKCNIITDEDIKKVLKNLNYEFDLLTKNNYYNSNNLCNTYINLKFDENNSNNRSSHSFPEIHDEFQAELDTLDQLNDSLCHIERMSCDMSIKSNEQSIELNDHCNSNNDNDVPTPFSKLNALSSNMICVDKTITGFSIQMFEQLIKDEELRAKQHRTILSLREKSLTNRLKWEITMYDLQVKNLKNKLGHEKQFQLFKQKQRGSVKKLENSLSQIKRLGRVIDSVYKQRFIMFNEHLQHLRNQSSSKKVIRKLKSLEQFPKIEEHACQSLNSHIFKKIIKPDYFDSNDSEHDKINPIESKNNTSPMVFESEKSKIILRNQATSPISIETNIFNQVQNVEVQTDVKCSSQSVINKSIQTSKTKCKHTTNENIKSFNPIDFSYKNDEMFDAIKTKDKRSLSPILPTSPVKLRKYLTETSFSTNSEQSDLDTRIMSLQEQLEDRKLETFRLKKEQKKLKLENLKAKEQDLLKQINLYDKKIEESRKSLMVEIKKKNMYVSKSSTKNDSSSSTNSSSSVLQNIINYKNDHSQHMDESDRIIRTDGNKYFYPVATDKECDHSVLSIDKPINDFQKKNVYKSKENCDMHTINFDSNIDNYNCIEQSLQSLETIPVCEDVQLHEKHIAKEVNDSNKPHEIETEVNIPFKFLPQKTLDIHKLNDLKVNLREETNSCEVNETIDNDINLDISLCKFSIPNNIVSETSNNQELHIETDNKKSLIIHDNINRSNTSSSNSSAIHNNLIINVNDTDVCEMQKNIVSQFEEHNYKMGSDDIYSPDFTSDEYTSEFQRSFQSNKNDNIIESNDSEQSNETSYEEDRSEGEIIFEDKTFIEPYSDDHGDFVQNENSSNDQVHVITTNIFNCLLKDAKKSLKSNMRKSLFSSEKNYLDNLTEETPLLLILKREEENQNRIILSEQASIISDALFKHHLQPLISETLQMYLPRLNEMEMEKLTVYLKWSSTKRKKLKLSECLIFQHKIDVDNENSFEMFYQKYLDQKKSPTLQDKSNNVMLNHTQQEAEKLKLEQIRIEEEIERLRMSEEVQFFLREIPNKPPPPYKSPTKNKALIDVPYTSDEVHKMVLTAANQVFNGSQSALLNNYIIDSDSIVHADYKTLIFDYCKEIAQDLFIDKTYLPLWKRSIKSLKQFKARPKNPKDLSDVVIKKMNQIIDIDECEEKVNKFVVKQMHEEDSKWTDFQMDELEIQNDIVENLMKKLVRDTITNTKTNFYLKFI